SGPSCCWWLSVTPRRILRNKQSRWSRGEAPRQDSGMNVDPPINFPELPRSELERAIEELVDKASSVLSTQGRLRSLLAAARVITGNLDLPVVLRSIAQAAVDLVGARYGA